MAKKKSLNVIEEIKLLLFSDNFKETSRMDEKAFTRNRLLPFTSLIVFMINLIRKTIQIELENFMEKRDRNKADSISKQALSKARKKLRHTAFVQLNDKLIEAFYSDNEYKTWEGFRLIGIDGSTTQLPSSEEIFETFGQIENQHGRTAIARISCAYDLLNDLALDSEIERYSHPKEEKQGEKKEKGIGERDLAIKHIQKICAFDEITKNPCHQKDLFLFDMGYPSLDFIGWLYWLGKDFVMRSSEATLSEVQDAIKRGKKDQLIVIPLKKQGRAFPKKLAELAPECEKEKKLHLRVLLIDLPTGEREVLITSLTDQKRFPYEEFATLYSKRWGSETNYSTLKGSLELENFTGRSALTVRQDFYATVLTNNIRGLIQGEVQEEVDSEHENSEKKYEYKVNTNLAIGRLKNELIILLLEEGDLTKFHEKLKKKIKGQLVPIRPGRSYPRKKKGGRKFKMTKRRSL